MIAVAKVQHRVDTLLEQVHADEAQLQIATRRLLTHGMGADDLPDRRALRALALLGDHERVQILEQTRTYWADLQERGLVVDPVPDDVRTPILRLLVYTLSHLDEIPSLLETLNVDEAPTPTQDMFQCPDLIHGVYWGMPLVIRFLGRGIEAVRIHADKVFDLEPVFVRASTGKLSGELEVLADSGRITFTLIASSGELFQHVLRITTATTLKELG